MRCLGVMRFAPGRLQDVPVRAQESWLGWWLDLIRYDHLIAVAPGTVRNRYRTIFRTEVGESIY